MRLSPNASRGKGAGRGFFPERLSRRFEEIDRLAQNRASTALGNLDLHQRRKIGPSTEFPAARPATTKGPAGRPPQPIRLGDIPPGAARGTSIDFFPYKGPSHCRGLGAALCVGAMTPNAVQEILRARAAKI